MFKPRLSLAIFFVIFMVITSCSTFNKMAVNTSSNLLYQASNELETQSNYESFKTGIPANLILIEGLLSATPENENILTTLIKGYAGYAFLVNETDLLDEEWSSAKIETAKWQALINYSRAFAYGEKFLKLKGITLRELKSMAAKPDEVKNLLSSKIGSDQQALEALLFIAQSYAALINLQKDNMGLVSELSVAKLMFDYVCGKKPEINFGTCDIFYGAYEAGRPQMLGGNPQKGKEIFLKAIEKYPHNWLVRASYMQYYLIPQNDQEGFEKQIAYLKIKADEFQQMEIYSPNQKTDFEWMSEKHLRLYQALALKRFQLMNKYQKQFF